MERNSWFDLFKLKKAHSRRSCGATHPPCVTEMLEVRALLTGAVDVDSGVEELADAELPSNVSVTQDTGYFEVAVGVAQSTVDQAIFSHQLRYPLDEDTPVLIDNGGLVPVDELLDTDPSGDGSEIDLSEDS